MSALLTWVAVFVVILVTFAYFYIKYVYSYWQRRGINSPPTVFPYGNFKKSIRMQMYIGEMLQQFYLTTDKPFIGLYGGLRPILMLRDPELIRNILIRDFQHFQDHGFYNDANNDPLLGNLFHSSGAAWRNARSKLTPTFTSSKMKGIFSTLVQTAVPLEKHISQCIDKGELLDVRELAARYATNNIASVGFGLDINCIDDPNTDFRKYGLKAFAPNLRNGLRFLFGFLSPSIMSFFKARGFDYEIYDFLRAVVEQNLEYREKNNIVRKDVFQLLLQLRNSGTVRLDDKWDTEIVNNERKAFTIDEITAQAFVFYTAGYETSSTAVSFAIYEISRDPVLQQKIQDEIDAVLLKHDGQLTYEALKEMTFLDACVDETLRKYPGLPMLNRVCTKEYTIPDTDIVLKKGTSVVIPVYALHYDEAYYPNPHSFQPSRFYEENRKTFNEMPYLPFGDGPRGCLGIRMGKMQTKVGIFAMLRKFKFDLSNENLRNNIEFSPKAFMLQPIERLDMKVSYR